MGSGDFAPDDSDLRASDLLGGSVDVGNSLTEVELGILWVGNTLDLNQRHIWVVHRLASLVREVLSFDVHWLVLLFGVSRPGLCNGGTVFISGPIFELSFFRLHFHVHAHPAS